LLINRVFLGFINKYRRKSKDTSSEELNNIMALKEQLIEIGYNSDEVKYMITTLSNGIDISKLDSKQLKVIEERLTEQLSIARQCIDFIRGPK